MLLTAPRLVSSRRSRAIQEPIFCQSNEFVAGNALSLFEKLHAGVVSIRQEQRGQSFLIVEQRNHFLELLCGDGLSPEKWGPAQDCESLRHGVC